MRITPNGAYQKDIPAPPPRMDDVLPHGYYKSGDMNFLYNVLGLFVMACGHLCAVPPRFGYTWNASISLLCLCKRKVLSFVLHMSHETRNKRGRSSISASYGKIVLDFSSIIYS